MAVIGSLVIDLAMKSAQFTGALGKTKREANSFKRSMKKTFQEIGGSVRKMGIASGIAATAVFMAGKKALDAYAIQEKAVMGLRQALSATGRTADGFEQKILDTATAIQKIGITGDEATIEAAKMGVTFEKITDDIFPRMLKVAADWSAATGQDMVAAVSNLGRASAGQFGLLSRYGIIIDENTKKSGDFSKVLDVIEKKFGGQQEAMRKTTFGSMEAMKNQFGDMTEKAGEFVAIGVAPFISTLTDEFIGLEKYLDSNKEAIAEVAAAMGTDFVTVLKDAAGALGNLNKLAGEEGLYGQLKKLLTLGLGKGGNLFDWSQLEKGAKSFKTVSDAVGVTNDELDDLEQQLNETGDTLANLDETLFGGRKPSGDDKEGKKKKAKFKKALDATVKALEDEEIAEAKAYDSRQTILDQALETKALSEAEYQELSANNWTEYIQGISDETEEGLSEIQNVWAGGMDNMTSIMLTNFKEASSSTESFMDQMKGAVSDGVTGMVSELIRLRMQAVATDAAAKAVSAGGGATGLLSGLGTFIAGAFPIVAGIAAVAGVVSAVKSRNQQQGHTGIDYVQSESPVLLRPGEAVLTPQSSRNLNAMLESGAGGGGGSSVTNHITINGIVSNQVLDELQDALDRNAIERARRSA